MVRKKIKSRRKRVTIVPRNANATKKEKQQEVTILGRALRSLGGLGGGALGGLIGMGSGGAAVGSSLGAALSKWLGSGDYSVSSNSIVSGVVKASTGIPAMHRENQSVIVRHKEYIGQLTSSINYAVRYNLPINPGRSETFPWLSGIAENFQEYTVRGMVYHYIPSSGSAIASTNNALGTVMFQTSYRANETAPVSKHELLNEYWAGETVPSETMCHPIECDPKENPFKIQYIRTGGVPTGDSQLLYDLGSTFIAVSGQQANDVVLGDIWVTYEIELRKPMLLSSVTTGSSFVNRIWNGAGLITNTDLFPAAAAQTSEGLLSVTGVAGTRQITFPVGTFGDFTVSLMLSSGAGMTNWTTTGNSTTSNCTGFPSTIGFDVDQALVQTTSTVTNTLFYNVIVRKVNKDVVATLTLPIWNASAGSCDTAWLRVTRTSI